MTLDSSGAISQARNYLQQGNADAARALLAKFVREHPEFEDGWLLLSVTLSESKQKADCLRQVLKLNPANEQARQQIEELQAGKAALQPSASPFPPGVIPAKVYVSKASPEPGLDFWEEDDAVISTAAESPPPAVDPPPAPSKIELPEQRPAEPPPASVPPVEPVKPVPPFKSGPFTDTTGPQIPNPLTGVEAAPAPAPVESATPSFAPDTAPEGKSLEPEKLKPSKSDRQASHKEFGAKETKPKQKAKRGLLPVIIIGVVLVMIAAAVIGVILITNYLSAALIPPTVPGDAQQALNSTLPASTNEPAFALPPSWTPTATKTLAPTSTATPVTPTLPPSATPTLVPPPATALAMMETIQKEVSVLRGLTGLEQVPAYIIPPMIAEQSLTKELLDEAAIARLTDEARTLSALGLIKPDYNLARFELNSMVDNFGSYYNYDTKKIYILEWNFSAQERYFYSHEYNHALVDQHFDIASLLSQENCVGVEYNDDRCTAIKALIEGDATLAMDQWLAQYASPEDVRQLRKYRIPDQAFRESFPPDYVIQSLIFPYQYGKVFVQELFDEGKWKRVNQAYGQLPQSTEQIMHPEKYRLGEAPVPIEDMPLLLVLEEEWRTIKTNTLGEWNTFLMLAYGAEKFSRQAVKDAEAAAAGWGGDQYQVYYNASSEQTTLAAHWVWDTEQDAQEFAASMQAYLAARFLSSTITLPAGMCWEYNSQTTCFYSQGNQSLWLLAPDQGTLELALSLYSQFQIP